MIYKRNLFYKRTYLNYYCILVPRFGQKQGDNLKVLGGFHGKRNSRRFDSRVDKLKYDKICRCKWFDEEGFRHIFEVEHTTDITKGLLRI